MENLGFIDLHQLSEFLLTYKSNRIKGEWNPPAHSAVHISAAITAYARIHMYPFISRDDCYYTDTNSIMVKKTRAQQRPWE